MHLQTIGYYPTQDKRTKIVLHSAGQYQLCAERSRIKIPEDKNYRPCPVYKSRLKR